MKKAVSVALCLLLLAPTAVDASSVTGLKSLNNEQRGADYKMSDESLSKIYDKVRTNSPTKEIVPTNPERDLGALVSGTPPENNPSEVFGISSNNFPPIVSPVEEQQLAWLVNNNIISREKQILVDGTGANVVRNEILFDNGDPLSTLGKTNFLMGMYKAVFGVIGSRPLLVKTPSVRNAEKQIVTPGKDDQGNPIDVVKYEEAKDQQVSGTGETYRYVPYGKDSPEIKTFDEGDYYVVVSPNVPELYLKSLVDKGIIPLDTVANFQFQKDYSLLGSNKDGGSYRVYPRWYNELNPYMVSSGAEQASDVSNYSPESKVWGDTFTVSGTDNVDISSNDRGFVKDAVQITSKSEEVAYFTDEELSTISALKYVESLLRLTEKDMTDTEARIVTYKYGASYLNDLEESDRKTVMFLTAKGILNFEDETEYKGLYSMLTKSMAYKLMYRVANKDARLDFSQIQLTDSDNFWIGKGFGQVELKMNYLNEAKYDAYQKDDGTYQFSAIPDVQTLNVEEKPLTAAVEKSSGSFLGIKLFTKRSSFAAPATSGLKEYTVTKVFDNAEKYEYRGIRLTDLDLLRKAEWVVSAEESQSDGRVTVKFKLNSNSVYVALEAIDSNIAVGTNFLFNTSGVTAVSKYDVDGKEVTLVPESIFRDNGPELGQKIAIMSDKVIKNLETGNTAVLLQDGNIALVGTHVIHSKELMVTAINGEKYYNLEIIKYLLSNAYISSLDPHSIYFSSSELSERLANVIGSTGNSIGKTYVARFNVPSRSDDVKLVNKFEKLAFVNISQLSSAGNFLVRNFEVLDKNKQKMTYTVIMQLTYRLPDKDAGFLNPLYKKSNPGFNDINNFIFKRPDDKELADWWDNNYYLSNAIANVFYGTKGVQYIRSGYLAPSLTVLYNSAGVIQEKHLQSFLQDVGAQLPEDWVQKFVGDTKGYNQPAKYGDDTNNKNSKFYPEKFLPTNSYPKWVHAMFNNSVQTAATQGYSGAAVGDRNNTELWRHLMESRKFSAMSGIPYGDKSKLYIDGTTTYIETNGGAIFTRISEEDPRFPSRLVVDGKVIDDDTDFSKGKEISFKPDTRTPEVSTGDWHGKQVTDANGNKFYVTNTSGGFFYLVDAMPVEGKPYLSKRGTNDIYEIEGTITRKNGAASGPFKNALKTRYLELYKSFTDVGLTGYGKSAIAWDKARTVTGLPSSQHVKGKTVYLDLGHTSLKKDSTKVFYTVGTSSYKTLNEVKGSVRAHVQIQLDANYWAINQSGQIYARKTFPELQVGNIYFSGINQGVIDSIIYKSVGVNSVAEIRNGAKLLVGDIEFTKVDGVFVSAPQENLKSWKTVLSDAENKTKVKTAIFNALAGMAINTSGKKTVDTSFVPIPLVSFVTAQGLAKPVDVKGKKTILGGGGVENKAYVYKYKDDTFTLDGYTKGNPPAVSGVVFYIRLDKNLVARKLDSEGLRYQLMLSTSALSEGYLSDVPFFTEDLNLNPAEDLALLASKTNFRIPTGAEDIKDRYLQLFKEGFMTDVQTTIKGLIVAILSYLIVVTWAVFTMLKLPFFYGLLEIIRNPSRSSNRSGIDLVRVLSFGIYNMDSTLSVAKLLLGSIAMVFIINLVLSFQVV